eukprot:CAMPEP_0204822982 /NCGR_PEP_ID=MMETSP1346-20131115/1171_1 /ASSEMBLY_ACC=CAM_ASM_000771 /TAXON_ID=215587 /ORGANISM="Aplanochytrium stocchinoi, Strain GSBS06" /LENGTH=423 /DNA_ID=CAMNT_0051949503 /DNA_START=309 /DNA_END=1577 /DNA_ORIENTATION=-
MEPDHSETAQGPMENSVVKIDGDDDHEVSNSRQNPKGMLWNVCLLGAGWCFGIASAFAQISTSALVATELAGAEYSTVPLGLIMLASAISAGFVPILAQRYGTKRVYLVGGLSGLLGGILCFVAVNSLEGETAFAVFVLGSVPQGFTYACTNNFRFVATQFSTPEFAPKAISIVMAGGIFAAPLGPLLTVWSRTALSVLYAGAYLQVIVLYILLIISLTLIDFGRLDRPKTAQNSGDEQHGDIERSESATDNVKMQEVKRPLLKIISRREVVSIIVLQAISYSGMAALMGVTPVSMSEDGFNFNQSTTAIVGHMLGMFVPSLFTGHLVAKTGPYRFMMFGFLVLLFGSLLFLVDRSLAIYTTGILIVGVGWNFSFIPASAIFTTFFTSAERGYVVGFNEFIVIGSVGIITATAGTIFEKIGSW